MYVADILLPKLASTATAHTTLDRDTLRSVVEAVVSKQVSALGGILEATVTTTMSKQQQQQQYQLAQISDSISKLQTLAADTVAQLQSQDLPAHMSRQQAAIMHAQDAIERAVSSVGVSVGHARSAVEVAISTAVNDARFSLAADVSRSIVRLDAVRDTLSTAARATSQDQQRKSGVCSSEAAQAKIRDDCTKQCGGSENWNFPTCFRKCWDQICL